MLLIERPWGSEETWVATESCVVTSLQVRAGRSTRTVGEISQERTLRVQQGVVTVSLDGGDGRAMRRGEVVGLAVGVVAELHAIIDSELVVVSNPAQAPSFDPADAPEPEFLYGEPEIIQEPPPSRPQPAVDRPGAPVIVIVEGDLTLQDILVRSLGANHTVHRADDGAHGLALLEALPPVDLVIADAIMPWMSGLELLRALKADEERARVPFVMLSSRSTAEDFAAALNAGARAVVSKPFKLKDLITQVQGIIGHARA